MNAKDNLFYQTMALSGIIVGGFLLTDSAYMSGEQLSLTTGGSDDGGDGGFSSSFIWSLERRLAASSGSGV